MTQNTSPATTDRQTEGSVWVAESGGYPLEGVTVALRHSRILSEDCADCESPTGVVDLADISVPRAAYRKMGIEVGDLFAEEPITLLE